jgi:hypothetical protein
MNIGIVYRIFYGDLSYIGSTINLKQRMRKHKSNYKNRYSCSSKEIMCYDYEVEVLAEIYYVENHLDINLRNLEREYIDQYKCVNKLRPITSEEEQKEYKKSDKYKESQKEYKKSDKYKEYKKEYDKEYKKSDKYKEYQKEYNKLDKSKKYKKEYEKTDKRKQYMKEYYIKNKSK